MITRERLKGAYSEGEALAIYNEVKASGNFIGFAREYILSYHEGEEGADYQVARNALWGLTKGSSSEISQLQPLLHPLIDLALATANSSVRRLSLNIIERLTIEVDDLRTDFYDFCLDHMTDVSEYPGIQSLCMKLAYKMSQFYPELMDELLRIIQGMEISYYKPAVKSVRNRILSSSAHPNKKNR